MIFNLQRFRSQWRSLHARIEQLENRLQETDGIVDTLLADAEYTPNPELGMNGQLRRKEVVEDLFDRLSFEQIVETGTFLGATTGYFAKQFSVPVYSSELIPRNHHCARRLLRNCPDVHLALQDSRSFLRALADQPERTSKRTFFYLDAHWYQDLPLNDEIDLIAPAWKEYVILIDDFEVPGDTGYLYDDYGPGKTLDLAYLEPVVSRHQLTIFFPKATSDEETGKKRGYCVVASPTLVDQLKSCELISQH